MNAWTKEGKEIDLLVTLYGDTYKARNAGIITEEVFLLVLQQITKRAQDTGFTEQEANILRLRGMLQTSVKRI